MFGWRLKFCSVQAWDSAKEVNGIRASARSSGTRCLGHTCMHASASTCVYTQIHKLHARTHTHGYIKLYMATHNLRTKHTHTHTQTETHTDTHTHTHIYRHTHTHTERHVRTHTHTRTPTPHTPTHTPTHRRTHTHTDIYIYIYIYIYTHTHICIYTEDIIISVYPPTLWPSS